MNGNLLYILGPAGAVIVASAVNLLARQFLYDRRRRRDELHEVAAGDRFIASIRLRLPPGAQMVVLQHQIFFNDERYRRAASQVFEKNNFTTAKTETYDKLTRYWLLAKRSTMIDHVVGEVQAVVRLVKEWNGNYESCDPEV